MVKNCQNLPGFFYEKWNNSWTKSWMNMKFQLSLYLIIPQSLQSRFFLKKCLFCTYQGKYVVPLDLLLRTQERSYQSSIWMKTKLNGYFKLWTINVLKYIAFNVHNLCLLFCIFFVNVSIINSLFIQKR